MVFTQNQLIYIVQNIKTVFLIYLVFSFRMRLHALIKGEACADIQKSGACYS